jgi:hypothetical protein
MTHLRQVPPSFRGKAYRAQSFGGGPAFRPERDRIGAADLLRLAESPLDEERVHGATLLMTTYHLSGPPGSRSRELDLLLARAGAEHFRSERMDQPAQHAAVQVQRQLYATLAVELEVVASPAAVEGLAAAYARLDVSGYWVKIHGFTQQASARELRGAAALLGALSATGRPVVACGTAGLHVALLVAGICSSVGLAEAERFWVPDVRQARYEGPRPRMAYHPAFLRSFQADARPARRAFARAPCRCGHRPEHLPPEGGAIDEHCAIVRALEAREASTGLPEERREWLRARATAAADLAHDADVDVIPYAKLEAVLAGVDAGRGDLADVA